MPRIIVCMAFAVLLVLFGTAALGFWAAPATVDRHVVLAVFCLVVSSLSQVAVFTYFTITGKLIAQALHLGGLDMEPLKDVRSTKRSATRMLALIVATVVFTTASGASRWRVQQSSGVHALAALLLILMHAIVYYREYDLVRRNARLVDRVLKQYEEKKRDRGQRVPAD